MLEIIKDKKQWDLLVKEIDHYDFHHTYDYHYIAKSVNETPILLKYIENNILIGLPLLIRDINGTSFKDATSVYGYAGPISKGITNNFNNSNFIKELNHFFTENKIISIFSRLNPYVPYQERVLKNYGKIITQGKVVNIDLTLNIDEQRQNYQNRLKTHTNKSRRNCTIKRALTDDDLHKFIEIYYENMDRVNAKKMYYFSNDYFHKIAKSKDFETETLLALDNESNKVIAGSMFIKTKSIVQYHLSGTKSEFLNLMPTKLLIDEMRIRSYQEGYTFFNLGGGLNGSDDDSLFRFKSSFSKDFKNFNLWNLIINPKAYKELVNERKIITKSHFFPLYRCIE